jgi:hypothetical protein
MAMQFLLLAAQAAGIGLDMYQQRRQERYANKGADIEINELGLQMEKEQLASSEEALANTERLREVMASQRALYAARGQKVGQGSPVAIAQRDINTFSVDERARQLSMSFRKHQIESKQRLIGLEKKARKSERKTKQFMSGLNLLNFNSLLGPMLNSKGDKLNG